VNHAVDGVHAGAADTGHDAGQEIARAPLGRIAKAQRIEQRDRPGAHGEHVADDAADAGGGALGRLDRAGVVVRLHLEHDRQAVADVDRAGVFAGALQDARAAGRQAAQQAF